VTGYRVGGAEPSRLGAPNRVAGQGDDTPGQTVTQPGLLPGSVPGVTAHVERGTQDEPGHPAPDIARGASARPSGAPLRVPVTERTDAAGAREDTSPTP
jgi:hypothetical protein